MTGSAVSSSCASVWRCCWSCPPFPITSVPCYVLALPISWHWAKS